MTGCSIMLVLLLFSLGSGMTSATSGILCPGTPQHQCGCNLTSGDGGLALGDFSLETVDWRVVVLAGLTGALASSLVLTGISIFALWKADQKTTPGMGNNSQAPRGARPPSSTSSASGSWAEPRKRTDTIETPRNWPEKLTFSQADQPSPRWSHSNAWVWPGSKNINAF